MTEIKRDGELSYITRTAPLLRGTARRQAEEARIAQLNAEIVTGFKAVRAHLESARKASERLKQLKGERP